jgi:hypothetical protein
MSCFVRAAGFKIRQWYSHRPLTGNPHNAHDSPCHGSPLTPYHLPSATHLKRSYKPGRQRAGAGALHAAVNVPVPQVVDCTAGAPQQLRQYSGMHAADQW